MLLLGLVAFILALKVGEVVVILTFSYAILYLISYLVFDVGWEWRYLMPSYTAGFLSVMTIIPRLRKLSLVE
jgi:CHASE2 domain-containing sensor protein